MKNIVVIECAHLYNNGVINIDGGNSIILMFKPLDSQTSNIRVIAQHADSSLERSDVLPINENGFVEFEMPFSWFDTAEVLTVQLTTTTVTSDPVTLTIEDSLQSTDDYYLAMDGVNFTVKKVVPKGDSTIPTKTSDLINDSNFISDANYHHTDVNFTDALKSKLDGIEEGATHLFYGTCDTAAGTAAKVATVGGNFTLKTGVQIAVKFTAANSIANPTLNVNGSGAISIKRYGTTAPSTSAASSWNAGSVVLLTYDGTYWQINNWLNTTYSLIAEADIKNASHTTARLISGQRFSQGFLALLTSAAIIDALGYTPYNSSNPSGYISGITYANVIAALGFTPYNSTNPNGYISGINSADVTNALGYTPLPLSGGTMTGQILTSFKNSVAMGSYGTAQTTLSNFCNEVRFSSGCAGSVSINTEVTAYNVTIPATWYNFIYTPHRSGGNNGSASGDNCNYGTLLLFGMTGNSRMFKIRISGSSPYYNDIAEIMFKGQSNTRTDRYYLAGLAAFGESTTQLRIQIPIPSGYTNATVAMHDSTIQIGYNSTRTTVTPTASGSTPAVQVLNINPASVVLEFKVTGLTQNRNYVTRNGSVDITLS